MLSKFTGMMNETEWGHSEFTGLVNEDQFCSNDNQVGGLPYFTPWALVYGHESKLACGQKVTMVVKFAKLSYVFKDSLVFQ